MRLRMAAVLLGIAALSTVAHAQVAAYGKFDFLRYSDGASPSTSTNFTGGGVGVYDDFLKLGPLHVGADLRGDLVETSKAEYRDLLVGLRVVVRVPLVGFRPYAQGSVGVGGGKDKGPYAAGISSVPFDNKLTYAGFAGLDSRVLPHIDWRVIELGFGSQSKLDANQPTFLTVSTGLVVRF